MAIATQACFKLRERGKRNKIVSLKKEDGTLAQSHEEIENVATDFYKGLFSAHEDIEQDAVLTHVQNKVTGYEFRAHETLHN